MTFKKGLQIFAALVTFGMTFMIYMLASAPAFTKQHVVNITNTTQKEFSVRMQILDKESGGGFIYSDPIGAQKEIKPNEKKEFRFELTDVNNCKTIEFLDGEKLFYSFDCSKAPDGLEGEFMYDVEIRAGTEATREARREANKKSALLKESQTYVGFLSLI